MRYEEQEQDEARQLLHEQKMDAETLEQIEQWHDEGWLVKLTWLPEGRPFIAQGSASEYNPQPDTPLTGTEGHISCELHWIKYDEECPAGYRWPHGMGPTLAEAVERCKEMMR